MTTDLLFPKVMKTLKIKLFRYESERTYIL
jgi:hypothetical protein